MTLTAQSAAEFERQSLEKLRAQYTEQGFTFIARPGRKQIPDFLGSYYPDAIAIKPGSNIVIEVKQRPSPAAERSLQEIRRLFEGHPDWQFVISYGGSDPLTEIAIPPASPAAIRSRMEEVRSLAAQGHKRAALVLGWSLLEAALHRSESEKDKRPREPGTLLETLATLGYISPAVERRLRPLVTLRSRIVHGDVDAEPTADDLESLLTAVDEALS
jgi:uncharacterized protein YutE (UPF0331/DUF86 family)